MSEDHYFNFGFAAATLAAIITSIILWHSYEAECQTLHNVADCEWSRTPFTPVEATQ